jgi:hypothetical protein
VSIAAIHRRRGHFLSAILNPQHRPPGRAIDWIAIEARVQRHRGEYSASQSGASAGFRAVIDLDFNQ